MPFTPDSFFFLSEQLLRDLKIYNDVFAIIGILYVGKVVISFTSTLLNGVTAHVYSKLKKQDDFRKKYGQWAVVTGCTEGIGRAYAIELARRGLDLILLSRNLMKLQQLSEAIELEFEVETCCLDVDFSSGPEIYDRISHLIEKKDIGILVNNVGVISPRPMYLTEMTDESVWEHVTVNVGAVSMMTKLVLPCMLEKKKGAIINLSSMTSVWPLPLLSVYSATKVYVNYFSQTLNQELQGSGIVVQTLTPSYISTRMTSYSSFLSHSNVLIPSASMYVQNALPMLGVANYTTGYWLHGLMMWMSSFLPFNAKLFIGAYINKIFRKKAVHGNG